MKRVGGCVLVGLMACSSGGEDLSPTPMMEGTATPTMVAPTMTPTPTAVPDLTENPGTLALRFAMEEDYIDQMALLLDGAEPVGMFYASVYDAEDVTSSGPGDSPALQDVEVYVDLRPAGVQTEVLYTTEALTVGRVSVLGYLDVTGNASDMPDGGEPVTRPGDNTFTVVGGASTEVTVFFGQLMPF